MIFKSVFLAQEKEDFNFFYNMLREKLLNRPQVPAVVIKNQ